MNRTKIQRAAALDAREAAYRYELQQPSLGLAFVVELDAAITRAAGTPHSYEIVYLGVRRVLMRRFPYAVYFILEDGVVDVIAILHQHQSPRTWQTRIKNK